MIEPDFEQLEEYLFGFVRHCRGLRELYLRHVELRESFYERLATLESVRTLTSFHLIEQIEFNERFQFDFLQNFR